MVAPMVRVHLTGYEQGMKAFLTPMFVLWAVSLGACGLDAPPPPVIEPVVEPPADLVLGQANAEACRRFVDTFNALSCVPEGARLDPRLQCPSDEALGACDQVAWWDCVTEGTTCEAGVPTRGIGATCPGPCVARASSLAEPSSPLPDPPG